MNYFRPSSFAFHHKDRKNQGVTPPPLRSYPVRGVPLHPLSLLGEPGDTPALPLVMRCSGYRGGYGDGDGKADAYEEVLLGRVDEACDDADDLTVAVEEGAA